jgi:hypothetical protein
MTPPNRPLWPGADGSFTLRDGRLYRLLLVVNGAPTVDELAGAMLKLGFSGHDLALSICAEDWADEMPPDWPAETTPSIAANEHLVRVSGSFSGARMRVMRDTPIAGGGTLTIAQAWDYGPARSPEQSTGAARPREDRRGGILLAGVLAVTGIAAWRFISTGRRLQAEEERLNLLELRAERARIGGRIRTLMSEGYPPTDAEAIAASESMVASQAAALDSSASAAASTPRE